jgi:hypothetical protein
MLGSTEFAMENDLAPLADGLPPLQKPAARADPKDNTNCFSGIIKHQKNKANKIIKLNTYFLKTKHFNSCPFSFLKAFDWSGGSTLTIVKAGATIVRPGPARMCALTPL